MMAKNTDLFSGTVYAKDLKDKTNNQSQNQNQTKRTKSQNLAESLILKPEKKKGVLILKILTERPKKARSDVNTPLQMHKERAVEFFVKRFPSCGANIFGVVDNILMGRRAFRATGCTDLTVLLELIDQIPGNIKDPVARLCDMVHRAPTYRE